MVSLGVPLGLASRMPPLAVLLVSFTPSVPPRTTRRPVTVTFVRLAAETPSARMRSPFTVTFSRVLLVRRIRLPSTVWSFRSWSL